MNAVELTNEINEYCLLHKNDQNVKKYQRYFKDVYDGYGLTTPQVTDKVKEFLKRKTLNIDIVLESLTHYLINGKYEEVSFGLLLLDGFSKSFTKNTFKEIEKLFSKGITNWAHADTLGMFILPRFLIQKIISIDDFSSWKTSPFKFQRRCVPVTFIKAMKKDKQCGLYIDFVESLMNDPEREVHQGVGWFLREAWKIDKEPVERILEKWKETAPRLIFQYACEKMSPEDKLKFRRTKRTN